MSFLKTNMKT